MIGLSIFNRRTFGEDVSQTLCSYYFDGSSHHIDFGDILESVLTGSNPVFSIRAVVRRLATGVSHSFLGKWNSSGNNRQIIARIHSNDKLQFATSGNGSNTKISSSTETFTDTSGWYDIIITFDGTQAIGSKIKAYSNNSALTISDVAEDIYSGGSEGLEVGTLIPGSGVWNGYINQVQITSDIITPSEVESLYNNGSYRLGADILDNLELDCIFDNDTFGGTNWTVIDDSGNGNNGTSGSMDAVDRDCNENPY